VNFLGIPLARYIDFEDSEQVLRAIRLTADSVPIDIILHTPGGLVLAAEQTACALSRHKADVTVFIPHYAMSGGMLIALAADEIAMDPNAVVGPVDPQIGDPQHGTYAAASILAALQQPNPNREDSTLILGDITEKAIRQVNQAVYSLIRDKMSEEKAHELADLLSQGTWTHDYPITAGQAGELGLPVREGLPAEVYNLMDLYPQAANRRPSVEFIPAPYRPSVPLPPGRSSGR
jgi:ClpP class serine protease